MKRTFLSLFVILAFILMAFPLASTFNNLLTRFVIGIDAYKYIENYIVPFQIKMVGVVMYLLGFDPKVSGSYLLVGDKNPMLIEIAWNCIGWQSLLIFLITLLIGFKGVNFSLTSRVKAVLFGALGTFLVNLLRITTVVLLQLWFGQKVALVFHDYGSVFITIIWLGFFWWFSYKYVLEQRAQTG